MSVIDPDYDEFMDYIDAIVRKGELTTDDKDHIVWRMLEKESDLKIEVTETNYYLNEFLDKRWNLKTLY